VSNKNIIYPFSGKICVPQGALGPCQTMASESELHITCIPARDRYVY